MSKDRKIDTECYSCVYKRNVPGDAHISCDNPDPDVRGSMHGVKSGWFFYPFLYDPLWKLNYCNNYQPVEGEVK